MKKNNLFFLSLWCMFTAFQSFAQSTDWFDVITSRFPASSYNRVGTLQVDEKYVYLTSDVLHSSSFYTTNTTFCKSGDTLSSFYPRVIPQGYLAQYTHEGQLKWVKLLGTIRRTSWFLSNTYSVVNKGFVYTVTSNMLSRDTFATPTIGTYTNFLINKIDENGNTIWEKKSNDFYYMLDIVPKAITTDADENIYVLFKSSGQRSLIFDSIVPTHYEKAVVYKFDKNGRVLFGVALPSEDIDSKDIKVDKKGNVYVLFSEERRTWSSSCRLGNFQAFVLRIDSAGKNIKKAIKFTSNDLMWCNRFDLLPNGDFVLCGSNKGQMKIGTFKTPQINQNQSECPYSSQFLMRLSNQGELIWHKSYPLTGFSEMTDISQEADGHLLVCGISSHPNSSGYPYTTMLNPPKGEERFFVKRLTAYGQMVDSVELYTNFEERTAFVANARVSNINGKTFAAFNYTGRVDTLGGCGAQYVDPLATCIVRLSDRVFQKRRTTPLSNAVQIFPNPAPNGQFFVKINDKINQSKTIRVYNLQGSLIQEKDIEANIIESYINLSNEAQGVYMVQILIGEEKFTYKIFKN